ncbi:hypothetical protein TNCT_166131 [Trichonephila clavata]|uniref:Uncharacterized protein n=1 Tax=Trichonephila clavata TaxID=2740835 RepID=A0A8X6GFX8_TRICU|nr:hypothetical protein TNCT_166131 [Trichonephila clavata]
MNDELEAITGAQPFDCPIPAPLTTPGWTNQFPANSPLISLSESTIKIRKKKYWGKFRQKKKTVAKLQRALFSPPCE